MKCEIFRTGKHTDSKGRERIWTSDDLDAIIRNFEEINPDVPICCGHPKSNSPAFGWVKSLSRVGDSLYAEYKNVAEEFKNAVNKGFYKTRSVSLTPDLILRHIAFLGGQTPAVKGLEAFNFENFEDDIVLEFENNEKEPKSDISEPLAQGGAKACASIPNKKGAEMSENFEKELEAKKEELQKKDDEIAKLQAKIKQNEKEKQAAEFEDFCDKAISTGSILPAQKQSVINILEACSAYSPFEFEADNGEKKTATEMFKDFIGNLKQFDFEESAKRKNVDINTDTVDFSDANKIAAAIIETQNEYKCKGTELTSAQALAIIKSKGV